jgi:hypothetical protein
VLQTLLAALFAALLVAVTTLAARRWGVRTAGVVSAFPAIVGPVLVLVAVEHGTAAAARNAEGTLLGLVGLAAFTAAYGWAARRSGWTTSLVSGWAAGAVASLLAAAAGGQLGPAVGLPAACLALWLAHRSLTTERSAAAASDPAPRRGSRSGMSIPRRMMITAAIVLGLAGGVSVLGPLAGGILAALPVLASLLAVLTHRDAGGRAAVELLRGTLSGMAGFVAFCEIVALLVTRAPLVPAFLAATLAALLAQAPALRVRET